MAVKRSELTLELLKSQLHYDPVTGVFTWLVSRGYGPAKIEAGATAGTPSDGYVHIYLFGTPYKAHRLAWFYMTGEWPEVDTDHQDLNRSNNAWSNLRDATRSQNIRNITLRADNKSGFKGVFWHKQRQKWTARIHDDGRYKHLGMFDTAEAAAEVFRRESLRIDPEFSRFE